MDDLRNQYPKRELRVLKCEIHPIASIVKTAAFYDPEVNIAMVKTGKEEMPISNGLSISQIAFDLTKDDYFTYIEVLKAKKRWQVITSMKLPSKAINAELQLKRIKGKTYKMLGFYTNVEKDVLYVELIKNRRGKKDKVEKRARVGDNIIFETNNREELIGIWIYNIVDDPGFKLRKKWYEERGY
jgi:hypothetical protein